MLCQQPKSSHHLSAGELIPLNCPVLPFDRVGIDFHGPLPKAYIGHWLVFVVASHLTRYVLTAPLHTTSAPELAHCFVKNVVLRHGAPRELLSNRGTTLLFAVIKKILSACNIVHSVTSSYHPDGITEGFNHTLSDMLSM